MLILNMAECATVLSNVDNFYFEDAEGDVVIYGVWGRDLGDQDSSSRAEKILEFDHLTEKIEAILARTGIGDWEVGYILFKGFLTFVAHKSGVVDVETLDDFLLFYLEMAGLTQGGLDLRYIILRQLRGPVWTFSELIDRIFPITSKEAIGAELQSLVQEGLIWSAEPSSGYTWTEKGREWFQNYPVDKEFTQC